MAFPQGMDSDCRTHLVPALGRKTLGWDHCQMSRAQRQKPDLDDMHFLLGMAIKKKEAGAMGAFRQA